MALRDSLRSLLPSRPSRSRAHRSLLEELRGIREELRGNRLALEHQNQLLEAEDPEAAELVRRRDEQRREQRQGHYVVVEPAPADPILYARAEDEFLAEFLRARYIHAYGAEPSDERLVELMDQERGRLTQ